MQFKEEKGSKFYFCDTPDEWIDEAIRMRMERDNLYENIYTEYESDMRWVGELGEITFYHWLKDNSVQVEWNIDEPAGKSDFSANGIQVDVKTVKRKVPPQPYYTAQISAWHRDHPADDLFFMSYEFPIKRMWLLGGIKKSEFLNLAIPFEGGKQVHPSYVIREGHKIYNIDISKLQRPKIWFKRIQ